MTSRVEFSNLPPEILQMISEKCDLKSRCNLQMTSRKMKNVVDSSKTFIRSMSIVERSDGTFHLTFMIPARPLHFLERKYEKTEMGTMVNGITQIEGKSPSDAIFDDFKKSCIHQKVTTIECLNLKTESNMEDLSQKFEDFLKEENYSSLLKIQAMNWTRNGGNCQLLWTFLKIFKSIKDIYVYSHQEPAGRFLSVDYLLLNQLNDLDVIANIDATQEELLALSASKIHLQSDKFTPEIMMSMLTKWITERKPAESYFILRNLSEHDMRNALREKVPYGFKHIAAETAYVGSYRISFYSMPLPDTTNEVNLRIGRYGIYVHIESTPSIYSREKYRRFREANYLLLKRVFCLDDCPSDDSDDSDDGWWSDSSYDGWWSDSSYDYD